MSVNPQAAFACVAITLEHQLHEMAQCRETEQPPADQRKKSWSRLVKRPDPIFPRAYCEEDA
jgi:hypothetical protein